MTTWLPYYLPLGKSNSTSTCPSSIEYVHAQDGYSVLGNPIHSVMSGTLHDVYCTAYFCCCFGIRQGPSTPSWSTWFWKPQREDCGIIFAYDEKLFFTGGYVILDCGFCVLKGFIELRNKGVFAYDAIKKRRYWTSIVTGKDTKDHFLEVEVGRQMSYIV